MSEIIPQVLPDKMQPGQLRYILGDVNLTGRLVVRGNAHCIIGKGMGQIIFRNLLTRYPAVLSYSDIEDRVRSVIKSTNWLQNVVKRVISELRESLHAVGLRIRCKQKLGYMLEFIPQWRSPSAPVPYSRGLRQPEKNHNNHRLTERVCPIYSPDESIRKMEESRSKSRKRDL